ncbi:MotA/TolQ/ExbB proton channel [gamma proteobacterium HTCC5015]|nr:MotA/TolQ/ExbB proton channel [gamma proteobacterium HTCC5015]
MRSRVMKRIIFSLTVVFALGFSASQSQANTLDELLKLVQQGKVRDSQQYQQRLQEFREKKSEQERLTRQATSERDQLQNRSVQLESVYAKNEETLAEEQARLDERMGTLKELFGVLQQVAGETKGAFDNSVISSQVDDRGVFLTELIEKTGSSSKLPSVEELERLWFEMQREMTYSGQVARYSATVVAPNGESGQEDVVRIGGFGAIAGERFLKWDSEAEQLIELAKQPAGRYTSPNDDLASASAGELTGVWIDPSRGTLLEIMVQSPELSERIDQGGAIGYIIIAIGGIGLLLGVWRVVVLLGLGGKIKKQMASDKADSGNPLGRVMAAFDKNKDADTETLELHLSEAIANEVPVFNRYIGWIKLIAAVAPLLGLLGTVTGMISVFETLALSGAGDPKDMAGGISQALMTTVLGLVAAIPALFMHALCTSMSRTQVLILEERATGILARQAERHHQQSS